MRIIAIFLIISWIGIDLASSINPDLACLESTVTERVEETEPQVEEVQFVFSRNEVAKFIRVKSKPWLGLPVFYLPSKKENLAIALPRHIMYRNLLI